MNDKDPNLFLEVFNQRAAVLTFMGMLGGSVRAVVLKTTWREGLRVVFVGGAVAFGLHLPPFVPLEAPLRWWYSDVMENSVLHKGVAWHAVGEAH